MTSTEGIELLPVGSVTPIRQSSGGRCGRGLRRRRNHPAGRRTRRTRNTVAGVNLGHVGFLAEAEPEDVTFVVESLIERRWSVEERTRLNVSVLRDGTRVGGTQAVERGEPGEGHSGAHDQRLVEVDGRPLSRWGATVSCARRLPDPPRTRSPAGGPVVWPEVARSSRGAPERPCTLRRAAGGVAEQFDRSGSRAGVAGCFSGPMDAGLSMFCPVIGWSSPPMSNRCASPASHRRRSPIVWWRSSICRSTVGVGVSAREQ